MNVKSTTDRDAAISIQDRLLIEAIEHGLPIVSRPYQQIARQLNVSEQFVIDRLQNLIDNGAIKRYGVVVRHKELGYTANGMVVWDVPDSVVGALGFRMGKIACVTLSYRRPRRLPDWPYNLFTMVHGRDRDEVRQKVEEIVADCDLWDIDYRILFSARRFKQCGARYSRTNYNPNRVDQANFPGANLFAHSHEAGQEDGN
jgi:DNA-binding Lrp family transcriptional regulator